MSAPKRITIGGVTYVREDAPKGEPASAGTASSEAKVERVDTCACGFTFRFGRTPAEIAASPLGLCGCKGLKAHKIAKA